MIRYLIIIKFSAFNFEFHNLFHNFIISQMRFEAGYVGLITLVLNFLDIQENIIHDLITSFRQFVLKVGVHLYVMATGYDSDIALSQWYRFYM